MNIPTIGGARGIFDILVPGMFLLINLGVVVCLLPFVDDETKRLIANCADNPAVAVIVSVVFGYLIGVILRLLRPSGPDRLSAAWVGRGHRRVQRNGGESEKGHKRKKYRLPLWASEQFPYIGYLGIVCRRRIRSAEVLGFYERTWAPSKRRGPNREFFNFCKTMIVSQDKKAAGEIRAAEALVRYMSGMFYALVVACFLLLVALIVRWITIGQVTVGLIIMLCTYLVAIGVILRRFRFVRTKEVETVFAASFKNRSIFEEITIPVHTEGEQ
jgi:hypothetical protein